MTVLDRRSPPPAKQLLTSAFPAVERFQLADGTPVSLIEDHRHPYTGVHIYHRFGASTDKRDEQGYATLLAEMLTKGTTTRSAESIAETIDFFGGYLSAACGWDATSVSLSLLRRHLDQGIELMKDILRNANFPDDELSLVRMQRLASIEYSTTDAEYLADTLLYQSVFGDHPYGLRSLGTKNSIERLDRSDLIKRYELMLQSSDRFIVAVGDMKPSDIQGYFDGFFQTYQPQPTERKHSASMNDHFRIVLIEKPSAVQSAIRIGHTGIHRSHPDLTDVSVMNVLLGGYFNSRINANLREKHGFTYGARSYFDARMQAGLFAVSTEVRTDVTRRAIEEILSEIRLLQAEPVPDDELRTVKNYLIGSFPMTIETPQQIAGRLANISLYGFPTDHYDKYIRRISEITAADIHRAATTYLHPDDVTVAVSGDIRSIVKQLDGLGSIELYNSDFERIS